MKLGSPRPITLVDALRFSRPAARSVPGAALLAWARRAAWASYLVPPASLLLPELVLLVPALLLGAWGLLVAGAWKLGRPLRVLAALGWLACAAGLVGLAAALGDSFVRQADELPLLAGAAAMALLPGSMILLAEPRAARAATWAGIAAASTAYAALGLAWACVLADGLEPLLCLSRQ